MAPDDSRLTRKQKPSRLKRCEAPLECSRRVVGRPRARNVTADRSNRLLILTHTDAARPMFAERTMGQRQFCTKALISL
jgi:hypothetical protein